MDTVNFRSFAIIPAAGRSRRMGRPKLLLPWGDTTVIERVLSAWRASRASHIAVVVHPDDSDLAETCRASGAQVVVPQAPPPDMKASVRCGLEFIGAMYRPNPRDAWLVAPADMPLLSAQAIDEVLAAFRPLAPRIVVPTDAGRRGHPVLFPWALAAEVERLGADEGLSRLFEDHELTEVPLPADLVLCDLDTPADYERWRDRGKPV